MKGSDLLNRTYVPLFRYFKDTPKAFRVLNDDYVSTGDGTGIVHQAPSKRIDITPGFVSQREMPSSVIHCMPPAVSPGWIIAFLLCHLPFKTHWRISTSPLH